MDWLKCYPFVRNSFRPLWQLFKLNVEYSFLLWFLTWEKSIQRTCVISVSSVPTKEKIWMILKPWFFLSNYVLLISSDIHSSFYLSSSESHSFSNSYLSIFLSFYFIFLSLFFALYSLLPFWELSTLQVVPNNPQYICQLYLVLVSLISPFEPSSDLAFLAMSA